jgi:rSAM/selenodomain-associated transferase 2
MITVSAIVPTLNEEAEIVKLLTCLHGLRDSALDIIVADGCSSDGTRSRAAQLARVITASRGRASQMNAAARVARGQVLWFLHADCRPHPESLRAIRRALVDPEVVGGAFAYALDAPGAIYRVAEVLSNWKNRALGLFFGDMGIFVRAEVFRRIGGYTDLPLMEDMDLCRRLKRVGRSVILPQKIMTSARRWRSEGAMRNIVRNWAFQIAWGLGASPHVLARHYSFAEGGRARDRSPSA